MKKRIDLLIKANQARIEKRYKEAINQYTAFLNSNNNAEVMWILTLTYLELYHEQTDNQYGQKAIYWLDKAITLDPNRAEFYVTRGNIFSFGVDIPDYQQAVNSYKMALELQPNLIAALFGIANLEGVPEEVVTLSEAIAVMEHAAELQPENPHIYLSLGVFYEKIGEVSKSQRAFERALLCPEPLPISQVKIIAQSVK